MAKGELVQVVDENDKPLRGASKQEIWGNGLRHRVARIMVEDEQGNILIQKRVAHAQLFPGCWDNSAAGHVQQGEDYLSAASRELAEEIGLKNVKLVEVKRYKSDGIFEDKILKRWSTIYKISASQLTKLALQPEEVGAVRWLRRSELAALITNSPESVTDGLREAYEVLYT